MGKSVVTFTAVNKPIRLWRSCEWRMNRALVNACVMHNIKQATKHNMTLPTFLPRSREEIAQYKERQAQVQKEAARTRELQRQMTAAKKQMKANQSTRNLIPADQKVTGQIVC